MQRKIFVMILCGFLALCGCSGKGSREAPSAGRAAGTTITDMAGREVAVPTEIRRVYCTGPVSLIIMYTIDPDLVVGLTYKLNEEDSRYLKKEFTQLPVLGGWYGKGNEGNYEEILKAAPDLILNAGTITEEWVTLTDKIQTQLGIPSVMATTGFSEIADMYDFLGELLDRKERTDELSRYVVDLLAEIEEKKTHVDPQNPVSVYYAEGSDGLQTDPEGSMHSEIIGLVGAVNAAQVSASGGGYGRQTVSIEQVLNWNPDVILVTNNCIINPGESSAYDIITTSSLYSPIEAVKNGRVYEIPGRPFNWFDRPPSVNRLAGIRWAASLIYPDIYQYDIRKEAKEFFKLFYRYNLEDSELDDLLYVNRRKEGEGL